MSAHHEEVSSQETDAQESVLKGLLSTSQSPCPPTYILDRVELLDKIIGMNVEVHHLESFYRELHLQAYPEMDEFVRTYQLSIRRRGKQHEDDEEPLPEHFLAFLLDSENPCVTMSSTVQAVTTSAFGASVKFDVKLYDGNVVETMITRVSDKGKNVASVSISSQVGCSIAGAYSPETDFVRDLSASEMVEQVIHALQKLQKEQETPGDDIRKVTFTGGGEPLLNYDSVVAACRFIADNFKLGRGCITIATVGITPRIFDVTRDLPNVILCLRLYAPSQELRSSILPISSRFGLAGIFEALDNHMATNKHQLAVENHEMLSRKRRVMIEYLMVKGKASTVDCAHELGKLCSRRDLIVTLVPFIRTSKDETLRCPSVSSINDFKATVASYDVQCSVRLSAGSDIRYSCVLKPEIEQNLVVESGTGEEKSEFWKELDSVKGSAINRLQTSKKDEEDSMKSESSMASDINSVTLVKTAFDNLLVRHNRSDVSEMGIESLELDGSDDDLPEVFLSSSQEFNMVLSDGVLFEDSFDDLCEKGDSAFEGSSSKSSLRARDRTIPSPNSLLDRVSFLEALEDAEIHVSMPEIDVFYKALHEMDYPPIDEFIQRYDDSESTPATLVETQQLVPLEISKFALNPLNGFVSMSTKIHSTRKSADSQSFRLYVQLHDDYIVETVVMRHAVEGKQHASISVSTQVSSPVGLSGNFNLQTSEIVEQIIHASRTLALHREMDQPAETIGKVSFLGCGEPLLNYDNLVDACFFMAEKPMWNINKDRMTVSTIGITPRIFDLTRDLPEVTIALDLRAPTQRMRSAVVSLAQRYSLDGLMEALVNHVRKDAIADQTPVLENIARREKVIISYKMVQGEMSKIEHAHELGRLCQLHNLGVNLVPYMRRSKVDKGKCPSMRHINEFKEVVKSYRVVCSVKLPLGAKVQDPKKQFVVQAEGRTRSKENYVRIKYRDSERSQIDFWETLAVVKKESIRKRQKSRELKSQKDRAGNWSHETVMLASFSEGVVSFAAVEGSMGMFELARSDVSTDENDSIMEIGDGNLQRSALSVEHDAFAFSPSTSATESLNQEGDESSDDHDASNVDCSFSENDDFTFEFKSESEDTQNYVSALTTPSRVTVDKTENAPSDDGVIKAVVGGGVVRALSLAAMANKGTPDKGDSPPISSKCEIQEFGEASASSIVPAVYTNHVSQVAAESREGRDSDTAAAVVRGVALKPIDSILQGEIQDGYDFELSAELMHEIQSAGGDDFSFSSAAVDHSKYINMLSMQQNMMSHIENPESEEEMGAPFCLYTIDEHETEDDSSEFVNHADDKQAPPVHALAGAKDPDFDSAATLVAESALNGKTNALNDGASKERNIARSSGTLEELMYEAKSAKTELDTSNKFLFSQMEQIALQANEELTAQIEQSEQFRQQMLEAQTLQRRAEAEREELEKRLSEVQLSDDSELLKERDELRERLSVLQFEHNELRAEKMRLENGHTNRFPGSLHCEDARSDGGPPQKNLADALEEIKSFHKESARLLLETDERSYEEEEELLEMLQERNELQKAVREAVKSLTLKEGRLAAALLETRRMERENTELALSGNDLLGKEELLDMWKENDGLQKALGEAIAYINEKEEEIERFEASTAEVVHNRQLENVALGKALNESAQALRKKEEDVAELTTLIKERTYEKYEEVESLLVKNLALEQHLAAAYRFTAPTFEPAGGLAEQIEYLEARISELEVVNAYLERNIKQLQSSLEISKALTETISAKEMQAVNVQTIQEQNDELRSKCKQLECEKADISAAATKEQARATEKCKLVADMAMGHLTGRLGLEARLQACEKERHRLTLDNEFMAARTEVVNLKSVMEIESLKGQVQHLRSLLMDARNQQTRAEEENLMLELEQIMSDTESFASSQVGECDDSSSSISGTSAYSKGQ